MRADQRKGKEHIFPLEKSCEEDLFTVHFSLAPNLRDAIQKVFCNIGKELDQLVSIYPQTPESCCRSCELMQKDENYRVSINF
jgi:hypothetical protein